MASITCSNCQTESAEGTTACPSCGFALAAAGTPPPPPPAAAPAPPAGAPPATPAAAPAAQIKFDAGQLSQTDRIVGIASIVLFISLFFDWYSASAGGFAGGSENGLSAHTYLYIVMILSIAIVALLVVRALGVWKLPESSPLSQDQLLLIATTINFVLVLIAFIFKPSGLGIVDVSWSFGVFLGLAASIVALVPLARPLIEAQTKK
jgi:hypothetical protein